MVTTEERQICRQAVETYGGEHQTIVAVEELSELQKELCKFLRDEGVLEHLYEELADVEIVIEQIKYMLWEAQAIGGEEVERKLAAWREKKVKRLMERIEAIR